MADRDVDAASATTTAPSANHTDAELVETYGDAVWRVEVEGCGGSGTGTAFAVDKHHLVTNAHVVGIDSSPTLRSRSGEVLGGRVIGLSSTPDVAVIEVDAYLAPALEWAPTEELGEGQHILTLGCPLPATDFSATRTASSTTAAGPHDGYHGRRPVVTTASPRDRPHAPLDGDGRARSQAPQPVSWISI